MSITLNHNNAISISSRSFFYSSRFHRSDFLPGSFGIISWSQLPLYSLSLDRFVFYLFILIRLIF